MKLVFGDGQEFTIEPGSANRQILIIHAYSPGFSAHLYLTKTEAEVLAAAIRGTAAEIKGPFSRVSTC